MYSFINDENANKCEMFSFSARGSVRSWFARNLK